MNFIIWLIAGAVVGWVASSIMGTNRRQGLLLDIVVGIVGAFVAGYFLSPYFGVATINQRELQHAVFAAVVRGRGHPAGGRQCTPSGESDRLKAGPHGPVALKGAAWQAAPSNPAPSLSPDQPS